MRVVQGLLGYRARVPYEIFGIWYRGFRFGFTTHSHTHTDRNSRTRVLKL